MAHAPQRHEVAVKKVPQVESLGELVSDAASVVRARGRQAGVRLQQVVREHPLLSVGLSLGGGVLIGVVGHRLFEHRPTVGEVIAERAGLNRLRKRVRRWL